MTNTQDIFKCFGPNWKWASMSSGGIAKVYVERPFFPNPAIDPRPRKGTLNEHWDYAPAFNEPVPPEGITPRVWERTEFGNGPSYETDKFGQRLSPPVACPPPVAPELPAGHVSGDFASPPPRPPLADPLQPVLSRAHAQMQLDANDWANYAAIDADGTARLFVELPVCGAKLRWEALCEQMVLGGTFSVVDWDKVIYPTTRPVPFVRKVQRAPRPAPPIHEGLSAADLAPGFPEGEDEDDSQHGWADELEEAKERAAHLCQHDALTLVQYMAIFGERP